MDLLSARSRQVGVWLLASCLAVLGQVSRESDVKAVFLFNFAQFVEWPKEAFGDPQAPLVIGILGTDPFKGAVENVVRDEVVQNRHVLVHHYDRINEVGVCHILFIGNAEARRLTSVLARLRGRPILTVSDSDDFARRGGMIAFYTEKSRVRLRINNEAARAGGLTISSKLLRVAEVIAPEGAE